MIFDSLPAWITKQVVSAATLSPWLASKLSALAINFSVGVSRTRPHPWSTAHDYISWTSLTNQRFSARHLPAYYSNKALPDPVAVRAVFTRPSGHQKLCDKSTCLFPAFAQYLTDGFIRTRMPNTSEGEPEDVRRQNTSNHQIDLCPLYGRTPVQSVALRLMSEVAGHRGRLKSQIINNEEYAPFLYENNGTSVKAEFKNLDVPLGIDTIKSDPQKLSQLFAFGGDRTNANPQVAMMNTLLLREHNRLAGRIEQGNPAWDDERVFETARIILIVIFIKLVIEEYINHIAPTPFKIIADAVVGQEALWNKPNWITTEFSLLYRWHSLIPDRIKWGSAEYPIADTLMNNSILLNQGLAAAFSDMSSQRAGKLGALNTAGQLLSIEDAAVKQARLCHVASYGAYREYVSLKPPSTFEDISSDPQVISVLKSLYDSPADVEFYVGLFAEDTVKNSPLPSLILRLVAVDAFSQALTNPLLSKYVYKESTFTSFGWQEISRTQSLADMLDRNVPGGIGNTFIGMTQPGWAYSW